MTEPKPPLSNEQCIVYEYKCDLCDAGCVGYRCQHLFQCSNDHKHSVIGKHSWDVHNLRNKDLCAQSTILKKYRQKLDCLIYEMLFIENKNQPLTINLAALKQKLLSDNSSAPRLEFYIIIFLLLIMCIETFTCTFHCIMKSPKGFYLNLRMMAWSGQNV